MSDAFARRYRLQERIAIGGTAEVFHALYFNDDGSSRPVVIKRVLPQFARDERFRRLFQEEACVAVTVTHPNIVRVLDHGDLEQTCYIALERVQGNDLGFLLQRARLREALPTPQLAAFIVAQVGEALQIIHDKTSSEGTPLKIIHRDVSPQNILVSYQGDVKLTDFGIAKSAIRQETTQDGTLRGKLDYMAPEQAALGDVDRRTDIFALGCVLYEMIHSSPPFRGSSEIETLERVRRHQLAAPIDELPVSDELRRVLERALQPAADDRYQQASELVDDLQAYMAGAPLDALREELGAWARELAAVPAAAPVEGVDLAVRQLLGGDTQPSDDRASSAGTAVFASSARVPAVSDQQAQIQPTVEVAAAPRQAPRPLTIIVVAVAILGIAGWTLWAMRYFGDPEQQRAAAVSHADATPTPAGLRSRAHDATATSIPLQIVSRPAGAAVSVDGEPRGKAPVKVKLSRAGPVAVVVRLDGYRPWRGKVNPMSGDSPIVAVLKPLRRRRRGSGFLTINSLPWSKVMVNGVYVGNTPLVRKRLPAGKLRVHLRGPNGKLRRNFQVTLTPGRTRAFTFDFTR